MADHNPSPSSTQIQAAMANSVPVLTPLPNFSALNTIKLSSTNFPTWIRQITPYLRSQRLMGYVDGSLSCPVLDPVSDNSSSIEDWQARDQLVVAILSASLTEATMFKVLDCDTAKDMWDRLHSLYSSHSSAQIVQTRLQLASLKKGSDESASDFYNRASSLVHAIQAAGQKITDNEFVVFLLAGLGTEYDAMVTSLSTQPTLPGPSQVLTYMILQENRIASKTLLSLPIHKFPSTTPPPTILLQTSTSP